MSIFIFILLPGGVLTVHSGATIAWGGELEIQSGGRLEILSGGNFEFDAGASGLINGPWFIGASGIWTVVSGGLVNVLSGANITLQSGTSMTTLGTFNVLSGGLLNVLSGANVTLQSGTSMTTLGSIGILSGGAFHIASGAFLSVSTGATCSIGTATFTAETVGWALGSWTTVQYFTSAMSGQETGSYGFVLFNIISGTSTLSAVVPSAPGAGAMLYINGTSIDPGGSAAISNVAGVSIGMMNAVGVMSSVSTIGFNSATDICRMIPAANNADWLIVEATAAVNFG